MRRDYPEGITPAEPRHLAAVAAGMRAEHRRETNMNLPLTPEAAVRFAAECSRPHLAGVRDGQTLFVAGVGPVSPLTRAGTGWLMGVPEMDRHGIWIAQRSREALPLMHRDSGAERIENWIPRDYARARKWLRWLGFREEPAGGPLVHVYHDHRGKR